MGSPGPADWEQLLAVSLFTGEPGVSQPRGLFWVHFWERGLLSVPRWVLHSGVWVLWAWQ